MTLLKSGEIVSCDLSPTGSNYTFFVKISSSDGQQTGGVYKPRDGEAPLWDFDSGTLYKREYAAYLLSLILGWDFIPETVLRDGPYGVGSVQRYVVHDSDSHYRTLNGSHLDGLRNIACFDIIANNADRKAVHCFEGFDGKLWGIDHGLTFNHIPKLRTVIWDFWGQLLPADSLRAMENLLGELTHPKGRAKELVDLLHPVEIEAMVRRINWLLELKSFPQIRVR
ncbi:SCO1664 family protein [SAR202 cluster bacterium AD-804-J14_MRT_500m]|nr:SCO1664 family protein [SAR202 cluster bacterium AD-804-J14_MRT_500m]